MKVTLPDGTVWENVDPVTRCTGYRAEKIELEAGDLLKLLDLAGRDADKFAAVMVQLDGRINHGPFDGPEHGGKGILSASRAFRGRDSQPVIVHSISPPTENDIACLPERKQEFIRSIAGDNSMLGHAKADPAQYTVDGGSTMPSAKNDDMAPGA